MSPPLVQTNYGTVRGIKKTSCYQKFYYAFFAIPYAKKAVGEFRFKSPRPLTKWTEPLDATTPGDSCWLFDKLNPYEKKIIGSDDCLHLNIYTPELPSSSSRQKLPVMIYFHGGRYTTMSGHPFYYGADYLMERDVILVTFNFRMGVFGFLSLKDKTLEIPGNAGLKDQVMALKWVKENIEYFGGDSNNITIFGQSSGATSVHYHLLSERSRDLFHRAIIMSGSAFVPWALTPDHNFAFRLVTALGYDGPNEERKVLEYLKTLNPHDIVSTQETIFTDKERRCGQLIAFGPVIEPYVTENDTFIPTHPFLMKENAWGNKIDVMIGGCADEGLLLYARFTTAMLKSLGNFSGIVSPNMEMDPDTEACATNGLKVKKYYFGDQEPNETNVDTFFQMLGHKTFWHGMWLTVKSRKNAKTYLYRFAVEPTTNTTIRKAFSVPHMRGTSHVEDVFYIFKAEYVAPHVKGTDEYRTMETMTHAFTSFARNGKPSISESITWEPVNLNDDIKCLNISNEITFVPLPETPHMKMWDEICNQHQF